MRVGRGATARRPPHRSGGGQPSLKLVAAPAASSASSFWSMPASSRKAQPKASMAVAWKLWSGSDELRDVVFAACAPTDAALVVEALRRISEAMSSLPARRRPSGAAAPARTTRSAAPFPRE